MPNVTVVMRITMLSSSSKCTKINNASLFAVILCNIGIQDVESLAEKISAFITLILSRYMQEVLFRCQGKHVDLIVEKKSPSHAVKFSLQNTTHFKSSNLHPQGFFFAFLTFLRPNFFLAHLICPWVSENVLRCALSLYARHVCLCSFNKNVFFC